MLSKLTKRNAAKAAVTLVANSLVCTAVEETIDFVVETDEDSDTVHNLSLGIGSAIYFMRWHNSLMNAVDNVADWRIARKEEKNAEATA